MSQILKTLRIGSCQPLRNVIVQNRSISRTWPKREKPSVTVASQTAAKEDTINTVGPMTHIAKTHHKYALVWTGKYKSLAEVPERVAHGVLDTALNKARIKIAIYMMIGTVLMACWAVYSGKKAAGRGESLALVGVEYHKQLREEARKEREAAAAKPPQ